MAKAPPQKEAIAVILDLNPGLGDKLGVAKEIASNFIQQKMVFSPRDEIGVIFSGTTGTLNRLNASVPGKYEHITVVRPIVNPVADFLTPINEAALGTQESDMLESLVVATDLIHESTGDRRYRRSIFLITNAEGLVKRKDDLQAIIDSLKAKQIALSVVGIDFEENIDADEDPDWEEMSNKQQNERVLGTICDFLGPPSFTLSVSDMKDIQSLLRTKATPQRTTARCLLSIGDIKIPIHLYTKTLLQAIPSMRKTTAKGDFVTEKQYFSAANPDKEIDATDRVKAFRYGKSIVPFNEVDEQQMKFSGARSMMAIGFVDKTEVPLHLLMGGVKAIASPPGDTYAATALGSFIHGMVISDKVMLVRYVWRENGDPVLGVCFPSAKATRNLLYFAPLPFAEDIRHYAFPTLSEVTLSVDEERAVENVVNAMTVSDDDVIKPKKVFNPALQQYYATIRTRYLDGTAPMPPLSSELKRTSCAWGEAGNVLEPVLTGAQDFLKKVAEMFPSAPEKTDGTGKAAKVFWFAKGTADPVVGGAKDSEAADGLDDPRPSKKTRTDNYFGTQSTTTTQAPPSATPTSLAETVAVTQQRPTAITTVDPVGTFKALLSAKGEDNVARALFEMCEVIFRLLRDSIGHDYYSRAFECLVVLRKACIDEAEPQTFNKFLLNLALTVRGEAHDNFWTGYIQGKGVKPITRSECEDSEVDDADAANFLRDDRTLIKPVLDVVEEDDFAGLE